MEFECTFSNDSNLKKELFDEISKCVIESAEETLNDIILESFKEHMQDEFYSLYKPKKYDRSYQMMNRIGIVISPYIITNDTVVFGVEFDSDKLVRDTIRTTKDGEEIKRYTVNGYDARLDIMKSILDGSFDKEFNVTVNTDRDINIIESMVKDTSLLDKIINKLVSKFISAGFIVE